MEPYHGPWSLGKQKNNDVLLYTLQKLNGIHLPVAPGAPLALTPFQNKQWCVVLCEAQCCIPFSGAIH